jgi:hypothetical protein
VAISTLFSHRGQVSGRQFLEQIWVGIYIFGNHIPVIIFAGPPNFPTVDSHRVPTVEL